ncbi:hypothetical protein FHY18_001022 [Xanthomonas arboricola]|nr:hypothetical protein [Xanthomonas sp. 3793]
MTTPALGVLLPLAGEGAPQGRMRGRRSTSNNHCTNGVHDTAAPEPKLAAAAAAAAAATPEQRLADLSAAQE